MNSVSRAIFIAEEIFKSGRRPVASVLLGIVIVCWVWIVPMALDMQGSMSGAAAWMMTGVWDPGHLLLLCAMWIVMMTGMMLPSAVPAVLDLVNFERPDSDKTYSARTGLAFMTGYIGVWFGFSLLAFLIHRFLDSAMILSPMMEIRNARLSMTLLAMAGAYQLTPLKRACLRSCRCRGVTSSPSGFQGGVRNGLNCLGCCWALMLLLFVGGVMNLWLNLGLTMFVLLEKIARPGWPRICVIALPAVGSGFWITSTLLGK
jgi:predicted metal-binding membrane protein